MYKENGFIVDKSHR